MTDGLITSYHRILEAMFAEDGHWLRTRTVEAAPRVVPPGAPEPPPHVLEPGEASAGRAIPRPRLVAGWVLRHLGSLVAMVSGAALWVDLLAEWFDTVAERWALGLFWPVLGLLVADAAHHVGDGLMERSRRRDALERATKEHDAALAGYVAELRALPVDAAAAPAERQTLYRRRLPRMEQTAAALAQARADMAVIDAPLVRLLRRSPS